MNQQQQQIQANEELLARAQRGDREATDALIRQYAGLVYGIALRQTRDAQQAADVSQAVFVVFVRRVASLRSARALPSWLLQTTRYAARETHRSATRRAHHEHRAARAEQIMDPTTSESDPKLAMLDDAIGSLRPADRDIVMARYLQGRDVRAIAADLGVAEEAARKRIGRAVERMREYFANHGVVTSADALSALLVTAGTTSTMPTAVLEACASVASGGAVAGNAGVVAKGVLASIGAAKTKVAAAVAAAVLVVTVGAIAIASATLGPRNRRVVVVAPPAATTTAPAMSKEAALAELNAAYALAPNQIMRVIPPPFPPARAAWADAEYPYAKGSQNIRSLGFRMTPLGLSSWFMSYVDLDLRTILNSGIRVPWYRVEGLDRLTLPPMRADLVVRPDATNEQKLQSLVDLVAEQTGKHFRVAKAQTTRPCIILKGSTRTPPESRDGFPTIVLTQAPLDDAALKAWFSGRARTKGSTHRFQFQPATELLGAPFFIDGQNGDGMEINVNLVLIAADAHLKSSDPLYETKLRKVLDNIEKQVGGEWRIERRTLDIFRIEPEPVATTTR